MHQVINAEQEHASKRAKSLWGDTAFAEMYLSMGEWLFSVQSDLDIEPRHYGEGKSWDEAFIAAGSSLFEPIPAYKFDPEDREILDRKCTCSGISTGIHGGLTRGSGRLDHNGYWQFPCTHGTDDVLTIQSDGQPVVYTEEQRDRDKGRDWNKDAAFLDAADITMYCLGGQILNREQAIAYCKSGAHPRVKQSNIEKYLDLLPTQTGVKSIDCTLESLKEYCQYLMDTQCISF